MSGTVVAKNVRINKKKKRSVSGLIGKIIGMINSHYKINPMEEAMETYRDYTNIIVVVHDTVTVDVDKYEEFLREYKALLVKYDKEKRHGGNGL